VAGEPVVAATDRHGHPTFAPDLVEVALELVRLGEAGTVHAVGPDRHTEFTFARLAAHLLGADVDRVEPCSRPGRVWLDRFKLRSLLGPRAIRGVGDGLRVVRSRLLPTPLTSARAA
jgi:dTDP-4-dehydrorhamnose reductase